MNWLFWIMGAALLFGLASVLALWSYGRFARQARGTSSQAIAPGADSAIDQLVAPLEDAHSGQSGLAAVFDNHRAFALRALSARAAGRSLDMLYYIWRDDMTGRMMSRELLRAADRGVRVRLLLDDVNVQGFDPKYLALNGHPGIEVRLFNPIRNRGGYLRRGLEMLLGIVRFNRRMHCKAWIADGRLALVGGRNIGDTYFGAVSRRGRGSGKRRNSRDLDLLLLGPAVRRSSEIFDTYWNSGLALPISALWKDHEADLTRFRAELDAELGTAAAGLYLRQTLGENPALAGELAAMSLHWTASVKVLADPPEKALGQARGGWMPGELLPLLSQARFSVKLVTPYFVPGREGMAVLGGLASRGVRLQILTNALSVTDHTVVHGAYRRYRRPLLAAGVALYEFAPPTRRGTPGEMLHGKLFLIDHRQGFVGSFNFDLRSAFLNTEMGILFEDEALVEELLQEFASDISPARAHALHLQGRLLSWRLAGSRSDRHKYHEPSAPPFRRGLSWVIGHLPIHSQL